MAPERAIAFVYGTKDDVRTRYSRGMAWQQSLELKEIQAFGRDQQLAYRYEFAYETSETTKRSLLQSVQACAGNGECYAPTHFHFAKVETGFEDIATEIEAPLSDKASYLLADVNGDGLSDYIVPDSTPSSTPSQPITEWRIAKNTGGGFGPEKVALLQEWSFVQDPDGPSDPTLIQPELGTSIDYDQDGLTDILLHDVSANNNNHLVLKGKVDTSFALVDTKLQRPFPIGQSPKGLRSSAGSVHLADCDGDSTPDLIQCTDHGETPDTAAQSTWKLHVWRPGGFTPEGEIIETLTGIPCGVEMHTVDSNRDSVTDLITPGYLREGGAPVALGGTYSVHRRRSDGTWEVFDTGLRTPASGGGIQFADVNGDQLPDAIAGDVSERLWTWMTMHIAMAHALPQCASEFQPSMNNAENFT